MNTTLRWGVLLGMFTTPLVQAGEDSSKGGLVEPTRPESRWRIGMTLGAMYGVEAEFSRLGSWVSPNTLQALGGGLDRTYDDGFNNIDSSGNAGGQTWNWGYANNSQYDTTGTGSLDLSIYNSQRNGQVSNKDSPHLGFSIFGLYDMGEVSSLSLSKITSTKPRWGLKTGFAYNRIGIDNSSSLTADVTRTSDNFALNGVLPPLAPYSGSFSGAGPLLSDNPTRTTSILSGGAQIVGKRKIDADLFVLSAGPYLEFALTEKWALFVEGGLNLGIINGEYDFSSSTMITGAGSQTTSGSKSETELLGGLYLGVGTTYQINKQWAFYSDLKYQYLSSFDITANGSKAELNFDHAAHLNVGVLLRF